MTDDPQTYPPAQRWAPSAEPQRRPLCCWVAGLSSLTTVALAALLWLRMPAPAPLRLAAATPPPAQAAVPNAAVPAALQPYLEAATKGDTHAMRMLGAMYYHGLDLPRNRDEGLKWYRKAADSGSKVAKDELRQLE